MAKVHHIMGNTLTYKTILGDLRVSPLGSVRLPAPMSHEGIAQVMEFFICDKDL